MVERCVNSLRQKQENRMNTMLSLLCVMLMGSIAKVIGTFSKQGQGRVTGLYGTIMLFDDVGGYVMVGVLAFIAAVVITMLCIRYREKGNKLYNKQEDKED
jgi:uncharacterized protein HemY